MSRRTKGAAGAVLAVAFGVATTVAATPAWAQGASPAAAPPAGGAPPAAIAAQFPECTRQPTEPDVDGAKGAHKAATQFFERGDYERAIQYWRDAYGFDCSRPPLLLNIASAYEKKGDKAAAVAVLELFLARAGDSPDAPTVRAKIENLRAALDAERASAPPPLPPPPPPPPLPPPSEEKSERPFGVMPWVLTGTGAGLAVIGLVPLIIGTGKVSDAEKVCPVRSGCPAEIAEQGNTGRTLSLVGQIMIPIGLVAAGSGLVWQFGFNQERPPPASSGRPARSAPATGATLVPIVSTELQGAFVSGTF